MLPERPRRGRATRWVAALVAIWLGVMLIAPVVLASAVGILTANLFGGAQEGGEGPDQVVIAAAQDASSRCASATTPRLMAVVLLPPPGPAPDAVMTPLEAWGRLLNSSGQYDALRDREDAELEPRSVTRVIDAVAIVWCALYPQISATDADSAAAVTYLALGSVTSADEAIAYEPSAIDRTRARAFESLAAEYAEQLAQAANARTGTVSADGWTHPVPDLSRYQDNYGETRTGYTHSGEDLSAPMGTPIYAAAAGTVTHVSCRTHQGRSPCNVIIDHGSDPTTGQRIQTWYVHMYPSGVLVNRGDQVTAGQPIARTGSNGNSSGPHLHLEVHLGGTVVDPSPFFAVRGVELRNPER